MADQPSEDILAQVLEVLRTHRRALVEMGVLHASVFGSVARGAQRDDSDIDLMVEVDSGKVRTIFDIGEVQQTLEEWIGRSVDVARRDRLRPQVAAEVEREAVHAF